MKQFKVSLKLERNQQRYRVIQIVGPSVTVATSMNPNIRAGDMLTENEATALGEKAVLATK